MNGGLSRRKKGGIKNGWRGIGCEAQTEKTLKRGQMMIGGIKRPSGGRNGANSSDREASDRNAEFVETRGRVNCLRALYASIFEESRAIRNVVENR